MKRSTWLSVGAVALILAAAAITPAVATFDFAAGLTGITAAWARLTVWLPAFAGSVAELADMVDRAEALALTAVAAMTLLLLSQRPAGRSRRASVKRDRPLPELARRHRLAQDAVRFMLQARSAPRRG